MGESANWQAIMDRQAIVELIYRYCRAMDRIDAELGYSIWHEDAVADYGAQIYQGSGRGFIDHVCEQHRRALTHTHQVTNITIELEQDRAASESYVTSVLRFMQAGSTKQITTWGRYIDTWTRRGGRWGIDKRIAIVDLDEIRDAGVTNRHDRGRRDKTDPSYAVLRVPR